MHFYGQNEAVTISDLVFKSIILPFLINWVNQFNINVSSYFSVHEFAIMAPKLDMLIVSMEHFFYFYFAWWLS